MSDQSSPSSPHWLASDTHPELTEKFKEAMREIMDPEIGLNVIQLGLIRNLVIEEDHAMINMILTTPFCPYGPEMIEDIRQKAESALGLPSRIDLAMDPWDFSMMEDGLANDWGFYR